MQAKLQTKPLKQPNSKTLLAALFVKPKLFKDVATEELQYPLAPTSIAYKSGVQPSTWILLRRVEY